MREPLVLPATALFVGIWLGRAFDFSLSEAVWPVAAFLCLALLAHGNLRRGCVLLALLMAGAFTEAWHRPGPPPYIEAGSRETVLLEGCVVEPAALTTGRMQFTLELAAGARARVSQFSDDDRDIPRLAYGQRVAFDARLRPPRNFNNPGAFDFTAYLARQHIYWTATVARGAEIRTLPGVCGSRPLAVVYGIRGAALRRIAALYAGDEYTSAMMEAILIGEASGIEKIWTEISAARARSTRLSFRERM